VTPTAGGWQLTLKVYDNSGRLVATRLLGGADHGPLAFTISNDPWDPAAAPLLLLDGSFSASFDGNDDFGQPLGNGYYVLQILATRNVTQTQASKSVFISRTAGQGVPVLLAPNPVGKDTLQLEIRIPASESVWVEAFNVAGERVATLGRLNNGLMVWDLKNAKGEKLGGGLYYLTLRRDGERKPTVARVAVIR
jgi:flagellar hook assembly protein FlgD